MRVLVTGAGGFIGHHLVRHLKRRGVDMVRGADIKKPEFEPSPADEFELCDLRESAACARVVSGMDRVFHLAADMGGIGYITRVRAELALNNTLIDSQMLGAAGAARVQRYLYASSACVYPVHRQEDVACADLDESSAFPANPEPGYGWEKLFGEQLARYSQQDRVLDTRIARFHNIYGPLGTWRGGREKAPAALCRKVAELPAFPHADGYHGEISVWGDGLQTRTFCYVNDCVAGCLRLMDSEWSHPINIGSEERIRIVDLVDLIASVAGKRVRTRFDPSAAQGVRGRGSNNRLVRSVLHWEPTTPLRTGLAETYDWIRTQVSSVGSAPAPEAVS